MSDAAVVLLAIVWLASAVTAALISQRKNTGASNGFLIGLVLGVIGLVIVICWKPGLPAAPGGMKAVKCPRCNAVQNIARADTEYECWQCKLSVKV